MPVVRATTFALYDRILDGQLGEVLASLRAEGLTFDQISQRLDAEYEVPVTRETVRRWLQQLNSAVESAKAV
ncbi:MAG: hypothetical protein ACYDA6_00010 [Solirubrobacteraceae bacterium]